MNYTVTIDFRNLVKMSDAEVEEKISYLTKVLRQKFSEVVYEENNLFVECEEKCIYRFIFTAISDMYVSSKMIHDAIDNKTVYVVYIRDSKFSEKADEFYKWANKGEMTFSDGSTYNDNYYNYLTPYGTYVLLHTEDDKNCKFAFFLGTFRQELEASTVDQALDRFEKWYFDYCWKQLKKYEEELKKCIKRYEDIMLHTVKKITLNK